MEASEDSIQVFIRIKPGQQDAPILYTQTQIKLDKHQFAFDKVFPPQSNQSDIFQAVGTKLLSNALDGYNSCVFVYGQTGSGKTHTMIGQDNGLMQNSFNQLFSRINLLRNAQCLITCSYFELYNQQIIDLIEPKKQKKLNIRQDARKGVFVQNLAQQTALDSDRLMQILYMGMKNRHIGQTQMNRQSSRSHSIFTISLSCKVQQDGKKVLKTPKLHFVDLAGSQRQKHTMASGDRLKQAGNINKSLTTLGMVINALTSEKPRSHIPYRDSKLTCLLRDSLGGNSKTIIIATISSSSLSFQQTLSTLNFANRAKMVKVKALINQQSLSSNIEVYKQQIRRLKAQLLKLRSIQHKSPFKMSVSKKEIQNLNQVNMQQHFQKINKKIGDISQQLNQNIFSPSLETLLQKLNKNKYNMTPIPQMCDQAQQIFSQKQNIELIDYLNSNYNLLASINKKVNQYLQIKEQLRNLAFNRKLAIEEIKTPSKSERDMYEEILKKKEIQIKKMEEQIGLMQNDLQNKEVENKQLTRKLQMIKGDQESSNFQSQEIKLQFFSLQKQVDKYKLNLDKVMNDKVRIEKHLMQTQSTLKQTKQLYFYSEEKYQNEKYCKQKLQAKIHQMQAKIDNYEKVQKKLVQNIKEQKQKIQKLKLEIEQQQGKQEQLMNEIQELTQTIQYNKKLFSQLTEKYQRSVNSTDQKNKKIQTISAQFKDLKILYEKQKFQSQMTISSLKHKNVQFQRNSQRVIFELNRKTQILQDENNQNKKDFEQMRHKTKELLTEKKQLQSQNYRLVQELQMTKMSICNMKKDLMHQLNIVQIKLNSKQSEFSSMTMRNKELQNQFQDYVSHSKKQIQSLKTYNQKVNSQKENLQLVNQKQKKLIQESKQLINNASLIKSQNQQLQKSYKEVIKENYKLKGKYNFSNQELQKQKNQQLISKVSYYEQKFKLMSIQYQKVTQIVKRLKQKQLQQSKKLQYYEENDKLNKFDTEQINEQNILIKQLREQNRELKNKLDNLQSNLDNQNQIHQNNHQNLKFQEKQKTLRKKLQASLSKWDQISDKNVKDMSTQQLIDIWETMQKQSKIKFDSIAKGIRRQQKLKSQNSFILKENIYLRQKIANFQKQQNERPRKLVKSQ